MAKWTELSDEEILAQIARADEESRRVETLEPRAIAVRYEPTSRKFVVDLSNETTFIFPAYLCQGLADATDEERAAVTLTPAGTALLWDALDVGLTLPGLMKGIFGTRAWMAELGKKGGRRTSEAKSKASRANGMKGGRPRKAARS